MKRHHITYLLFFFIFLLIECCGCGCYDCGYDYECYATNTTIIFKNGIPVDTFNFYDTQYTWFRNKCVDVVKGRLEKGPLYFSKDSILNFFHTEKEYISNHQYLNSYDEDYHYLGLIVEYYDNIYAPTLFITPEGYKLLELYDYDSVTMVFTFDEYRYALQSDIDDLAERGYKFH